MSESTPHEVAERRRIDALTIADAAGALVRGRFGDPGQVLGKAFDADGSRAWDLVTEVDHESEQLVRTMIAELAPDALVLGEEEGTAGGPALDELADADELWIVDPIDGTVNFAHGIPHCCVSIACWRRGRPLAGAIVDPIVGEAFTVAVPAGGRGIARHRTIHGEELELRCSATLEPEASLVAVGGTASGVSGIRSSVRGWRRIGSAALALAWVAAGRLGAYVQLRDLSAWDHAVGVPLVVAAGGIVTDPQLEPWADPIAQPTGVIAGAPRVHERLGAVVVDAVR